MNSGLLFRFASYLIIKQKPKKIIPFLRKKFKNLNYKKITRLNLHTEEISNHVAILAKQKKVRQIIRVFQKQIIRRHHRICCEGRDQASTILRKNPRYDIAFYFKCNLTTASYRRWLDLGKKVSIKKVKNVINKDPSLISIYTPAPWKYQVLETLINSNLDLGTAMGILMQNEDLRTFGNEIKRFSTTLLTYLRQQSPERLPLLKLVNEFDLYSSAKDFFKKELGAEIELYPEDENSVDPSGKASQSLPLRR